MQREKRDLYDKNGIKTDKTYYKGDSIPDGYYPMVVMIALENNEGKFLMQKRSLSKGGDWGVTGGHPKSGESCLQGIVTEVKEELGIDISNCDIVEFCSGCDGKDCYKMFYAKIEQSIDDMTLQQEELIEVMWFSLEELKEMANKQVLNEDQIDFYEKFYKFFKKTKFLSNQN